MGTSESIKNTGSEGEDIIQDYFLLFVFTDFPLRLLQEKEFACFPFVTFLMWVILLSTAIDCSSE